MTGLPAEGRRRVAISTISPQVDGGRYPVKAIVGDRMPVHVDAFPDGHGEIRVVLRHRPSGARDWVETEMTGPVDDRWRADLVLSTIGLHGYDVAAWLDPWRSWRRDLGVRVDEVVLTDVDLDIGQDLVASAASRARGADAARLGEMAASLGEHSSVAVEIALSNELSTLMDRHPDRRFESTLATPLSLIVDPVHAQFGAWYELFPRSTSPTTGRHGTLHDVIGRLDYIGDLGFDVLYLPPIHPIGQSHRKGPDGSLTAAPGDPGVPWAIGDATGGHMAIHAELGGIDDFDALVAAAGERGIHVALDLAFQTSPDHPWVSEHRDWFRDRPDGTIQYAENPPKKYEDALPLDFETGDWHDLWAECLKIVRYWMDHGVRIFRVDNPHTKPFAFWEWLITAVKTSDPDVIFLAEAFTRPKVMYHLANIGFSQSYTYFTWRNEREELESYFEEITRPPVSLTFRPNLFANTPDILHAYLQQGGRTAFEIRFVLAATLGASYGVYGPPFELAEGQARTEGSEDYLGSEKYELRHWDLADPRSIAPLIGRINTLRRDHPALQTDRYLHFHASRDQSVIAYSKRDDAGTDVILTVVNLDARADRRSRIRLDPVSLDLPAPDIYAKDLIDGKTIRFGAAGFDADLGPATRPFAIYRITPTEPI